MDDISDPKMKRLLKEFEQDVKDWADTPLIGHPSLTLLGREKIRVLAEAPPMPKPLNNGEIVVIDGVEHILTEVTYKWSEADPSVLEISYVAVPRRPARIWMTARLVDAVTMKLPDFVPADGRWSGR